MYMYFHESNVTFLAAGEAVYEAALVERVQHLHVGHRVPAIRDPLRVPRLPGRPDEPLVSSTELHEHNQHIDHRCE